VPAVLSHDAGLVAASQRGDEVPADPMYAPPQARR
jgi:hypothetical protein